MVDGGVGRPYQTRSRMTRRRLVKLKRAVWIGGRHG
jgi:hypothetical protein